MQIMIDFEMNLYKQQKLLIAGVDEVGRGCLAGPMVVAAVILNSEDIKELFSVRNNDVSYSSKETNTEKLRKYSQIKDSKKLSAKKRRELTDFIKTNAICYSIFEISALDIDKSGISVGTQMGFLGAVNNLPTKPEHILTDAFKIKTLAADLQSNIIKGDSLSITIAAASILAKTFRDELIENLGKKSEYSAYGFGKHKGYGTKMHLEMIGKYGPCDQHRRSFEPIKSLMGMKNSLPKD